MEISKKVLEGLETCSNASYFSDQAFEDLCEITFGVIMKDKVENDIQGA